ncbi:MAG TPA: cell division protein SepF [Micromonosporaceae bacterium]
MSALRKAGVWLGLVEEDDERGYDDRGHDDRGHDERGRDERGYDGSGYERGGYREPAYRQSRYAEELGDDDDAEEAPTLPRMRSGQRSRPGERGGGRSLESADERMGERSSVRSLGRPAADEGTTPSYHHTRDNLALAPQVQLGERAVVADEEQRYQITTLHPTTYREARTIGEHFRDGVPVIINLTEMEEADARRLVDFAAGLAFGLRGTIERVTNRVFLLSPANVQVTAEDKAKIAQGGFFSLS